MVKTTICRGGYGISTEESRQKQGYIAITLDGLSTLEEFISWKMTTLEGSSCGY